MSDKPIFDGRDMFNRRVIGTAGKDGSIILAIPESGELNDDGDGVYPTMSLTADSAAALAAWIGGLK